MASSYTSRPLIPEVLVSNDVFSVIRERQAFEKIIQDEKLAAWLQ